MKTIRNEEFGGERPLSLLKVCDLRMLPYMRESQHSKSARTLKLYTAGLKENIRFGM